MPTLFNVPLNFKFDPIDNSYLLILINSIFSNYNVVGMTLVVRSDKMGHQNIHSIKLIRVFTFVPRM